MRLPLKTAQDLFNARLLTETDKALRSIPITATPETLTDEQRTALILYLGGDYEIYRGKIIVNNAYTLTKTGEGAETKWTYTVSRSVGD